MDNVMIERLWRSLKYECVYLQAFETGSQARTGIGGWIDYYNTSRPNVVVRRAHRRHVDRAGFRTRGCVVCHHSCGILRIIVASWSGWST